MIKGLIEKLRPEPRKVLVDLPPTILIDRFGSVVALRIGDSLVSYALATVEDDMAQDIVDGQITRDFEYGDDGLIYLTD